jgi:hypothetical protein
VEGWQHAILMNFATAQAGFEEPFGLWFRAKRGILSGAFDQTFVYRN